MNIKFVEKPWGFEEIWAHTQNYVGKILTINPGNKLSLQYHEKKEETIRVLGGTLFLHHKENDSDNLSVSQLTEGCVFHVSPRTVHRFEAREEKVILVEVSTSEITDVVRLEDDFGRI
jgi:mannose-6-phosphate isomerase-like protein (cupin superfamily)|tara:strand:+ start:9733 stop:10086 length:354 start_codon:yes stop_codon:yes gene_type:complete